MIKNKWIHVISDSSESIVLNINDNQYEFSSTPEVNKKFKILIKYNQKNALEYLKRNTILLK